MLFSIVIPTHNNFAELERCLHSLEGLRLREFEVIICVDGSRDGTQQKLRQLSFTFPVAVYLHPGNAHLGRSATRNLALGKCKGTFTLFLDSDMEVADDLLDRHLELLNQGKTISIGNVVYRNSQENVWARYTSERGVGKFRNGEEVPFNYFITPNTALPTEWWEKTGGFDEAIRNYGGEDMELGFRIHKKFWPEFRFNHHAKVFTFQEKGIDEALAQLREYGATSLRYITGKYKPLQSVYWVNKCNSGSFKDQLFGFLLIRPFREIARFLIRVLPYFLQKPLINYLVIAHVHLGYKSGRF